MNLPKMHSGLAQLIENSGVKSSYPKVALLASYYPRSNNVSGFGIEILTKFRLHNPHTPVLFFSFHSKDRFSAIDEFGVLGLPGTEFIHLPCAKETILQAVAKYNENSLQIDDAHWKPFSEAVCTALIKQILIQMKHNQRLDFVNSIGLGLRLAIENVQRYPDKRERTIPNFEESYAEMIHYFSNAEFEELFFLSSLVGHSHKKFLNLVNQLVKDICYLKDEKNKLEYAELRNSIIRIQESIKLLNKLLNGTK